MATSWLTADLHLGHKNIVNFSRDDGDKLRPWDTVEEHDEAIIENWNKIVRPDDKVYVLGDVVLNSKHLHKVGRLNGKKKLIPGNHDIYDTSEYLKYFYDIKAYKVMKDIIMSHIPLHESQMERFKVNVHGHMHSHFIDDPRYLCVSLEHTDFKPISLEEVRQRIALNKIAYAEKVHY